MTNTERASTLDDLPEWTLGDRLAKARKRARIGQKKMADDLLKGKNTVSGWENDRNPPPDRVLRRWAELTSVPVWWLLGQSPPTTGGANRPTGRSTASRTVFLKSLPAQTMEQRAA